MSRERQKLSAAKVKNAEAGTFYDGGGLQLEKTPRILGKWIYRYSRFERRRDMGLGPFPGISLAHARIARDRWENVKLNGDDPIDTRERVRTTANIRKGIRPDFRSCRRKLSDAHCSKVKKMRYRG